MTVTPVSIRSSHVWQATNGGQKSADLSHRIFAERNIRIIIQPGRIPQLLVVMDFPVEDLFGLT